jgi:hypothetical protein
MGLMGAGRAAADAAGPAVPGPGMSVVAHDVVDDVVVDDVVDDAVVNDHMAVVRMAAGRKGQKCGYQDRARRGRQAEPLNHHVFPPIYKLPGVIQALSGKPG